MQLIEPNFSDISHPRIPRKNLAEYKIEQETKKTEALTEFKNFLAEQHFTQKTETGGHTNREDIRNHYEDYASVEYSIEDITSEHLTLSSECLREFNSRTYFVKTASNSVLPLQYKFKQPVAIATEENHEDNPDQSSTQNIQSINENNTISESNHNEYQNTSSNENIQSENQNASSTENQNDNNLIDPKSNEENAYVIQNNQKFLELIYKLQNFEQLNYIPKEFSVPENFLKLVELKMVEYTSTNDYSDIWWLNKVNFRDNYKKYKIFQTINNLYHFRNILYNKNIAIRNHNFSLFQIVMTYFVVMFYFATDEQVFATGLFFSGVACQTIADFINEIFYNGITPANDNKVRRCVRASLNGDRFEFGNENTNDATFSEVDEVILMKFIEDSVENDEGLTLADATKHARQLVIERNKFMQLFLFLQLLKKEEKVKEESMIY